MTVNGGTIKAYGEVVVANDLTLNSGSFTVDKDGSGKANLQIDNNGNVTINGGMLTVNGDECGLSGNTNVNITINGGEVTVSSHASDFIKVSSYNLPSICFGPDYNNPGCYTFVDEANPASEFTGLHNSSDNAETFNALIASMAGKKLVPKVCTVTLPDGVKATGDGVKVAGNTVKAAVELPVTLDVTMAPEGKRLGSFSATDANNVAVTISNENAFTMPNSDVTVSAEWET